MNAAILLFSALLAATPVEPTARWDDMIADESLQKLAPAEGFIADAKSLEKLWKAWRPKEEVPTMDFKKEIIIVGVVEGPNSVMMDPSLDEKGDLQFTVAGTEVGGPGFGYLLLKISRESVKTVNGKPLEASGVTAWGKEVGGLQAGLGFRPGERRAYKPGETVKLVVRVRNVGKEEISFQYLRHFLIENPPTVVDDKGKAIPFADAVNKDGLRKGIYKPIDVDISAGQEIELYELDIELSGKVTDTPADSTLYGEGKFSVQYQKVLGDFTYLSSVRIKLDPVLKTLATGKLELEVKEAKKQPDKNEKEGVTAWGKEVGGLQAGLGYRPGQKWVYQQGETVTVVFRVRNVGKEAVDFKHIWAFFVENPPRITDADGKMVQLPNYRTRDKTKHMPRSTNVAPGKEVELYEWEFVLQPQGENSSRSFIHGTGKFSLQCERVVGPTWLNPDHPNPTMSKLATGKLELEINPTTPAETEKK